MHSYAKNKKDSSINEQENNTSDLSSLNLLDQSPEAMQARHLQEIADNSSETIEMLKWQDQISSQDQKKVKNETGIPDDLKLKMEQLSGYDLSDVKVYYNSPKPAEVGALAYTEGTNIYIGPGQEEYLEHELWHVIQQKKGEAKATIEVNGKKIDDRSNKEDEADKMAKEVQSVSLENIYPKTQIPINNEVTQLKSATSSEGIIQREKGKEIVQVTIQSDYLSNNGTWGKLNVSQKSSDQVGFNPEFKNIYESNVHPTQKNKDGQFRPVLQCAEPKALNSIYDQIVNSNKDAIDNFFREKKAIINEETSKDVVSQIDTFQRPTYNDELLPLYKDELKQISTSILSSCQFVEKDTQISRDGEPCQNCHQSFSDTGSLITKKVGDALEDGIATRYLAYTGQKMSELNNLKTNRIQNLALSEEYGGEWNTVSSKKKGGKKNKY